MNKQALPIVRKAVAEDAEALSKLIDVAGEGIPTWLWAQECGAGQQPLDIGINRARQQEGGFSYVNAMMAEEGGSSIGMVLSYPILEAPDDDSETLPEPIVPFIELEKKSVGTWYINALAVYPAHQGRGVGIKLLRAAEDAALAANLSAMSIQVYGQNTGALRLYQRLGYELRASSPVRLHPCQPYYTGDVLLLIKPLEAG